jgi:UDP-N-acetylmuramyl pentapeptide phosphotransferase/UDP-N-acetylglucosamine-1-phosphate transferase
MSLISLIITLIVVGVLLWLINNYVPMDSKIRQILNMVVVVAVVVWLLNLLGLMDSIRGIRVGR